MADPDARATAVDLARAWGFDAVHLRGGPAAFAIGEASGDTIRPIIID